MGFIDETQLDPINASTGGGGNFITAANLDPLPEAPSIFSSDFWLTRPSGEKISPVQALTGPPMAVLDGLTRGLGDEIVAGGSAGLDAIFRNQPLHDAYNQRLNEVRGIQENLQTASPVADFALNLAGGIKDPIFANTKDKALSTIAKEGALYGAQYGFNEGEGGIANRATSAAIGGAGGAIAAPVATLALSKGTQVVGNYLAEKGLTPKGMGLASQRGSISSAPANPGGYTPDEILLAQQLKNTPLERIQAGAADLNQAAANDVPLFLPEAVQSPKIDRNARFIANYDPSIEFSQNAIKARTAAAEQRATSLFDQIAPNVGTSEGATKLAAAADDIIKAAEGQRQIVSDPLYKAAYSEVPVIKSSELSDLMGKDDALKAAINSVRKTANNAELPENATKILVKARQELSDQIETAIAQGRGRKARDLTDTYNRLNSILHSENPTLKAADLVFSEQSGKISELNDSFLKSLQNITADKLDSVGQIFTLPVERIKGLRARFEAAGKLDEWNAGIRSHLQNLVETTKEGTNFTSKFFNTTAKEAKLKAALGDSYDPVAKGLSLENRFFEGKNKYHAGSSTAGNIAEENAFSKSVGMIGKLKAGDWKGAFTHFFSADLPEETAQALAKIYFETGTGAQKLNKIIPLLKQYAKVEAAAESAGRAGAIGGTQLSTNVASKPKPTSLSYPGLRPEQAAQGKPLPQSSPAQQGLFEQSSQPQKGKAGASFKPTASIFGGGSASPVWAIQNDFSASTSNPAPSSSTTQDPLEMAFNSLNQQGNSDMADNTYRAPPELIEAQIHQESRGKADAVSPKGATGLMQIMPDTAKDIARELGVEKYDLKDPETSRQFGEYYLNKMINMFDGDFKLGLAAYNAGPGVVQKWIEKYNTYNWDEISVNLKREGKYKETRDYVPLILNRAKKLNPDFSEA